MSLCFLSGYALCRRRLLAKGEKNRNYSVTPAAVAQCAAYPGPPSLGTSQSELNESSDTHLTFSHYLRVRIASDAI